MTIATWLSCLLPLPSVVTQTIADYWFLIRPTPRLGEVFYDKESFWIFAGLIESLSLSSVSNHLTFHQMSSQTLTYNRHVYRYANLPLTLNHLSGIPMVLPSWVFSYYLTEGVWVQRDYIVFPQDGPEHYVMEENPQDKFPEGRLIRARYSCCGFCNSSPRPDDSM
jgi:hypothetical protein